MLNNPTPGRFTPPHPRIIEARSIDPLRSSIMKSNIAFIYSSLSVMLAINSLFSLGCCVNRMGWGFYPMLLLSVGAFFYCVQMWNSATFPNSR